MSSIKLDGITLANTANSKAVLDSAVQFPAGHIIQQDSKIWHWNGDNGAGQSHYPTIATFGPVISMQLKNANAKVGYTIYMSRATNTSSTSAAYFLMGKTSAFSASGFSITHGASIVPPIGKTADGTASTTGNEIGVHAPSYHLQVTLNGICQCSNTANQTLYFSAGAQINGNYIYYNYDGNFGVMTFTLSEIQV